MTNNYKIKTISLVLGTALGFATLGVSASQDSETLSNQSNTAILVSNGFGPNLQAAAVASLKYALSAQSNSALSGDEDFNIRRQWVDSLGKSHTHFNQTIRGIKVYGTSMIMHTNQSQSTLSINSAQANNYSFSGTLAVDSSPSMSATMSNSNDNGIQAMAAAKSVGKTNSKAELAYIYLPESGQTKLAWKVDVKYNSANGFEHDEVFYDVSTSEELTRHPQVHRAKVQNTYNMNNQAYNHSSAPGSLVCSTGQSCSDASAARAHSGASTVYDYYADRHNRDGINNAGMNMISSVHTGSNWNNAVWYNNQMFYGDGDGSTFTDLTSDFDIIAHELTHGVTSFTANLVYQNESGALNEAWSDIMGVSAEAYKNGTTNVAWLLGDGAYTPGTSGDALRYMDNPTQDGSSKDYYPERYTGSQDNGGVHWNSGIANLAYSLLVDGGTHPRNKTTVQVPGIGVAKAEAIFYRALTTYFTQSTGFSSARTGTAQAASDLYGETEKTAVETAWCAVGVGSCPSTTPPTGGDELDNGVAKTGLGASTGSDIVYTMDVPAGATNISFVMSGGSGDADLYVKFGSAPTDSSYDCRPYKTGNSETCTGTSSGGTYYVRIKAYSTFSNVSLTGSYTDPGTGGTSPINETISNISVSLRAWTRYTQVLPAGYSNLTITMSGGSGDADLYVRRGAQSTTSSYDCRPYKNGNSESCSFNSPAADTWYIDVYGYSAASGVTINVQATP